MDLDIEVCHKTNNEQLLALCLSLHHYVWPLLQQTVSVLCETIVTTGSSVSVVNGLQARGAGLDSRQ
jgi:hypothetical protein